MITFDSEDNGKGDCFLYGFFDGRKYIPFELRNYNDEIDFRKDIIKFIINSGETLFIAHNLEYDLSHIFQGEFLTVIDWYYSSNLIFAKLPKKNIKFIDSFHFSYVPLDDLGKEIRYKKKKIDVQNLFNEYKKNPDKVLSYNKTDCEIVYKYMERFIESIESDFNLKIKNTLSGTAQSIFLKNFTDLKLTGYNNSEDLLNSYYGGRVECFYIGEVDRPVFEIDVNSMYPYVMQNNLYPVSEYFESVKPVSDLYISEIEVEINPVHIPIIPVKKNKLFFGVGKFQTYATSIEIKKAMDEGQIKNIKYLRSFNFPETDYIFKKFIEFFYSKRKIAKDLKNEFESGYYKRIMNHVYGRFALHKELKKLTEITTENYDRIIPITRTAGYLPLDMSDKSKNYSLSIFVTAYARIELYNLLKKVSKFFDILYCDTDSCYFTSLKYIPLMNMIDIILKNFKIDNELGNYSLCCYESGIFYNVKAYLLNKYSDEKKIKLKGIRKEYREEFLTTGHTEYRKPLKMRSSLRNIKGIKVNSWELQSISRKGVYDKREKIKIAENLYSTKPLNMGE